MAGDWIKMRSNLWDDPRVTRLVDLTGSSDAAIVGGLYWLWATADQHSEDGVLHGMSPKTIDRKTGVQGLGDALVAIGWIEDTPEGVRIVRFDEHNGESAKCRAQTAKRVAKHKCNAKVTQTPLPERYQDVTEALPREREREREETKAESKAIRAPRFDAQAHLSKRGIPAELSADWIRLRKAKKAEVTKTAIEGIANEAAKAGLDLADALRECCARGWAGFKADWMLRDGGNARAGPVVANGRQSRIDNYAAQAAAARGDYGEQHGIRGTERDITGEAERIA